MSANGIQYKALNDDPVLAKAEMGLTSCGNEIAQIMAQSGAANTGRDIMNCLAGMMAQGSGRGGYSVSTNQGSSAGPAIAAGVAGIALGAGGAVALAGGGRKPVTPPKPTLDQKAAQTPASAPVTGAMATGSAAAPGSAGASIVAAGQAAQTPSNQPAPNPEQLVTIGSQNQLGQAVTTS